MLVLALSASYTSKGYSSTVKLTSVLAVVGVVSLGISSATPATAAPSRDNSPPQVVTTDPVNNSINVGVAVTPKIVFNEAIQSSSLNAAFSASSTVVPGTFSYDSSTFTVTFKPSQNLSYSTKYTGSVKAKDLANNQMKSFYTWSFTTSAAPPPPPVNTAPVADLTVSPSSGVSPLVVHLDASGSTDDVAVVSYVFDFGDGTPFTTPEDVSVLDHTYTAVGTWIASVTARDSEGKSSTAKSTVVVNAYTPPPVDNPPDAKLTVSPQSGQAPLSVTADASGSTDNDTTGIASYAFNWGDGSVVTSQDASTAPHNYSAAGDYTVTVVVTDTAGQSSQATANVSVMAPSPPTDSPAQPTVVSLGFDDGTLGHYSASQTLAAYNLKGTFYINSGRIGATDYMSLNQLQSIAASGNEIAGHTIDHADLATLTSDDAARQICNDRVNLHDKGFKVTSFAYPFGSFNATVVQLVKNCGYNNARKIADLRSDPYGCLSCITANPIPPTDLYAIKTNTSVRSTTTLSILQKYVTQAEQDKGGLVPLVFHHIGNGGGTDEITPEVFTQFVAWLANRPSTTQVKTMGAVIGGTEKPYVLGPPLPSESGNLVQNPSLEVGTSTLPTCFNASSSSSTYTYTLSRDTASAHSGSYGETFNVTSYTSGDRKLYTKQEQAGSTSCSPVAAAGHRYTASVYYKGSWSGSTKANLVTYYRDSLGTWKYWETGPLVASSSSWVKASMTTSVLPSGATSISYGLAFAGTGIIITDDYSLTDLSQ